MPGQRRATCAARSLAGLSRASDRVSEVKSTTERAGRLSCSAGGREFSLGCVNSRGWQAPLFDQHSRPLVGRPSESQMRCTEETLTPTAAAMAAEVRWVASCGGSAVVSATT